MDLSYEHFESIGITVYQPVKGYRYGEDTLALAYFANIHKHERVLEIGAGVGVVSLILSKRFEAERIVALELQKELYDILCKNIDENNLQKIIKPILGDYRDYKCDERFDVIVTNPPFYPLGDGKLSPQSQKAYAHHEMAGDVDDLIFCISKSLKESGRLYLMHLKLRKEEIVGKISDAGFRLVNAKGQGASLILLEFLYERGPFA